MMVGRVKRTRAESIGGNVTNIANVVNMNTLKFFAKILTPVCEDCIDALSNVRTHVAFKWDWSRWKYCIFGVKNNNRRGYELLA